MAQTEHIIKDEGVDEIVVRTIRILAKLGLQEQAMSAVAKHESN
jgi:hypothetical protein